MGSRSSEIRDLLKQVSRSFYLTLRILPSSVQAQLNIAYLLARTTDTIADTRLVDIRHRQEALFQIRKSLQEVCEGRMPATPDFGELAEAQKAIAGQGTPAERMLLENLGKLFATLRGLRAGDRLRICSVLDRITHGQEMDLIRFGTASAGQIAALHTHEELDAYIYDVAGCVGEFWTQICRTHAFPQAPLNDSLLLADAIRFGKGLQLVNILRDLPKDLRQGRCYLPEEQLAKNDLKPRDLLNMDAMRKFLPLFESYLKQAEDHLSAGWRYTMLLPHGCVRIRLACAWPILIGIKTIERLRKQNILDDRNLIKLSRSEIRKLLFRSTILYPFRTAWNCQFNEIQQRKQR